MTMAMPDAMELDGSEFMSRIQLAANCTTLYTEWPLLDRVLLAADDGFQGVECLFPYELDADVLGSQLARAGVELVLINAPPGDWESGERGLAGIPGKQQAFRESIGVALDYAGVVETRRVHVMHGIPADGAASESVLGTFVENMQYAAELAAAAGIELMVEALNPIDVPGYPIDSQAITAALLDDIGRNNVRMQFDLYHCQRTEGGVTEKLRHYIERIGHIQIAGVPGRHEPDEGELAFEFVFAELERLGYAGWVGCEYHPRSGTREGLGWAAPWGIAPDAFSG
jgi:hydroxypyruvate isomerase